MDPAQFARNAPLLPAPVEESTAGCQALFRAFGTGIESIVGRYCFLRAGTSYRSALETPGSGGGKHGHGTSNPEPHRVGMGSSKANGPRRGSGGPLHGGCLGDPGHRAAGDPANQRRRSSGRPGKRPRGFRRVPHGCRLPLSPLSPRGPAPVATGLRLRHAAAALPPRLRFLRSSHRSSQWASAR
jgi:hypothetical protein